jgi:predicted nuclease with TOPRIM domain
MMPQYKTLTLQLIRQYPGIHYPLKEKKKLLETVEKEAKLLAKRHKSWQDQLSQAIPECGSIQIELAALELAMKELENRLTGLPDLLDQELILDAAIAFLRTTPPE